VQLIQGEWHQALAGPSTIVTLPRDRDAAGRGRHIQKHHTLTRVLNDMDLADTQPLVDGLMDVVFQGLTMLHLDKMRRAYDLPSIRDPEYEPPRRESAQVRLVAQRRDVLTCLVRRELPRSLLELDNLVLPTGK